MPERAPSPTVVGSTTTAATATGEAPTGEAATGDVDRSVGVKVRFHELDPNGHLNHGVYLNLFETARIEVMERLGLTLPDLHARGVHLIVVEVTVRFTRPAVAGDTLTIDSHLTELRPASARWHQRLRRGDDQLATADVRSAVVDAAGRPTRPPPDLVAAMQRLRAD